MSGLPGQVAAQGQNHIGRQRLPRGSAILGLASGQGYRGQFVIQVEVGRGQGSQLSSSEAGGRGHSVQQDPVRASETAKRPAALLGGGQHGGQLLRGQRPAVVSAVRLRVSSLQIGQRV